VTEMRRIGGVEFEPLNEELIESGWVFHSFGPGDYRSVPAVGPASRFAHSCGLHFFWCEYNMRGAGVSSDSSHHRIFISPRLLRRSADDIYRAMLQEIGYCLEHGDGPLRSVPHLVAV